MKFFGSALNNFQTTFNPTPPVKIEEKENKTRRISVVIKIALSFIPFQLMTCFESISHNLQCCLIAWQKQSKLVVRRACWSAPALKYSPRPMSPRVAPTRVFLNEEEGETKTIEKVARSVLRLLYLLFYRKVPEHRIKTKENTFS